ncbi:MAG: isoprenyl transferase [bacterium]
MQNTKIESHNASQNKSLLNSIDIKKLPKHVAIIMDGNGRWAHSRNLPRTFGHQAGTKAVRDVVEGCAQLGIEVLTLYAFSTENWSRPENEVSFLMKLLRVYLKKEVSRLQKNNIRLLSIGAIRKLAKDCQDVLLSTIDKTSENTGLKLVLALNYGSRDEIIQAIQGIVDSGEKKVTEKLLQSYLYTRNLPNPDLLIRTSGEMRISNFLLWQIAYSEIYFTPVLWPDFKKEQLYKAIIEYQSRNRRFGGI